MSPPGLSGILWSAQAGASSTLNERVVKGLSHETLWRRFSTSKAHGLRTRAPVCLKVPMIHLRMLSSPRVPNRSLTRARLLRSDRARVEDDRRLAIRS